MRAARPSLRFAMLPLSDRFFILTRSEAPTS